MKQEDNIEKLFQGAFENFEVTPPVSVKAEIDKQLDNKKIRPRWIFWWATIILLFLGGAAFAVINGGFFEASSGPALSASDQHATTSNGESKPTEVNSDDQLSAEGSSAKKSSGSGIGKEANNAEKKKAGSENKHKSFVAETEKRKTLQNKSLKSAPKRTAFSVKNGFSSGDNEEKMNGSASGKSEGSYFKRKNTANGKKGMSEKSSFISQKGVEKKTEKKNVNGGKQQAGSNNDGVRIPTSKEKVAENPDPDTKIPENMEKQPETVPEIKSGKDPVAEKKPEPADSAANVTASVDSTNKTDTEAPAKPSKDNAKAKNWMVEIYGGPRFDAKTSKTDFALKSANSYQIGLGFSRSLNLGPLKYVTLDGEYGGGKESYRQTTTSSSIYLAGIDSIPYFDTITDTIPAGYTYYDDYDTIDQTNETENNAHITRFAFGLRAQFNFNLGSGFGIALSPGYYYSRSKYKFSDSSGTSSSSQILLNLSVYYDWNRFRFRVGLDSRYELMGKNQNTYFDRRKSMLFTPQFGVAVKF